MPGPNFPYTSSDADQVIIRSFDDANDRLRVDASVTATIGDIIISAEESDIAIKDRITDNFLHINSNGSIDANVEIDAADGDNIALSNADGSKQVTVTTVGATESLDVNVTASALPSGAATAALQTTGNTSLASIDAGIPAGLGQTTMSASMPVTMASDQTPLPDVVVTGSFTAASQTLDINTFGRSMVTVSITGTWNMFIGFSASADGVNFSSVPGYPVLGADAKTLILVNGTVYIPCGGYKVVRLSSAFYTSGTAVITMNASVAGALSLPSGVIRSSPPTSIGSPVSFTNQAFQFPGLNQFGQTQVEREIETRTTWGKSFTVCTGELSTGTGLKPAILIRNPAGSARVLRFHSMVFSAPQAGNINYHVFQSPTVTTTGTAMTPVGGRQTGQTAAVVTFFTTPTVSASGTRIFFAKLNTSVTSLVYPMDGNKILDPGFDILISFEQSSLGAGGGVTINYSEVVL